MKVGVVGSRSIKESPRLIEVLNSLGFISLIVSGGAAGVDTLAEWYAHVECIDTLIFKPDYRRYGKRAPLERNTFIVDACDVLVAVWDGVSKGTMDTVSKARKFGKRVILIEPERPQGSLL